MRQNYQPITCFKLLWSDVLFPIAAAVCRPIVNVPLFTPLHDVPHNLDIFIPIMLQTEYIRASFDSLSVQIMDITVTQ